MRPKIDLAAAAAAVQHQPPATLTVAELVAGFTARNPCDYDWRLRKWVQAFGQLSAWELTSEALEAAAEAMIGAGYKPSTVNRDLSSLGSAYRWAKASRLGPRGFQSPTRFNVGGNKYRLVVETQYQAGIVWVKLVGTHAQYDRIEVYAGASNVN